MAKCMKIAAAASFAATIILAVLYRISHHEIMLTLAITFGTVAYHLIMRLSVGLGFNLVMHNRANCARRWYRVGRREQAVYETLGVKKWKSRMPTYDNSMFNRKLHSWSEIASAMCQAELVHETIVLLSFLPIVAGVWFGAYPVFIITSILSAALDMMFVMMQRYNRCRVMQLLERNGTSGRSIQKSN